jgi:hypothetical protein
MLREIVERVIADEPDMELVGPSAAFDGSGNLDLHSVDVVISGRDDPGWAADLLRARPGFRVLALTRGGKEGLLYELRPHRVALGEMSPQQLVAEIRYGRSSSAAKESIVEK